MSEFDGIVVNSSDEDVVCTEHGYTSVISPGWAVDGHYFPLTAKAVHEANLKYLEETRKKDAAMTFKEYAERTKNLDTSVTAALKKAVPGRLYAALPQLSLWAGQIQLCDDGDMLDVADFVNVVKALAAFAGLEIKEKV